MTSDVKAVQLSLEEIRAELEERIAALPAFQELDGQLYRKSPLSGVYYPVEVEKIERFTKEEWEHHLATHVGCRHPKAKYHQEQKKEKSRG